MTAECHALPACTALASQSEGDIQALDKRNQSNAAKCRPVRPTRNPRGRDRVGHLWGDALHKSAAWRLGSLVPWRRLVQRQPARPAQRDRRAGTPRRCRGRSGPCAGHHGYYQARRPWGPPPLQRLCCPAAVGLLHPGGWVLVLGNVLSDVVPALRYCTCLHQNVPVHEG